MFEKKLAGFYRLGWLASGILGLMFIIVFGKVAIDPPAEFPSWARLTFALGVLYGIGWAILGFRVYWRGKMHLKKDASVATGMTWGFVVIVMGLAMTGAPDSISGIGMILISLVFMVIAALFMVRHIIEQSELKTREKLLEIEYRLAELAEGAKSE